MPEHTTYHLVRPATVDSTPIDLDDDQRRVVDHESGPLLVLAGPGTGKTTTLVEAIADRVERRGADPSHVLALTFSRKAAEQLRDRVTARAGPHDRLRDVLDDALVRLRTDPPLRPARALPRPPAAALGARAGRRRPRAAAASRGVGDLAVRVRPRARDARLRPRGADGARASPREGHGERRPRRSRRARGPAGVRRGRAVPRRLPHQPRRPVRHRLRRPDPPSGDRGPPPPRRAAPAVPPRVRGRVPRHRPRTGRPPTRPGRRRR